MGVHLTVSPIWNFDPVHPPDRRYSVLVYLNEKEPFCRAYGPTEDIARLRAALICMAVNKTKPVDEEGLTVGEVHEDRELRAGSDAATD